MHRHTGQKGEEAPKNWNGKPKSVVQLAGESLAQTIVSSVSKKNENETK